MIPLMIYQKIADKLVYNLDGESERSYVDIDEEYNGLRYLVNADVCVNVDETELEALDEYNNSYSMGSRYEITSIVRTKDEECTIVDDDNEDDAYVDEPIDWDIVEKIVTGQYVSEEYEIFHKQQRRTWYCALV